MFSQSSNHLRARLENLQSQIQQFEHKISFGVEQNLKELDLKFKVSKRTELISELI